MNAATEHSHTVASELLSIRSCMSYLKTAMYGWIYAIFFGDEAADLGIHETLRPKLP